MLKQTKEYKEFTGFVGDCGGNVRAVNTKAKEIDELTDDWMPEQAYTTAHDFRKKFGAQLTPELVNVLLSDLNKIWRESVRKQLSRVKSSCKDEVDKLKR